MTRPKWGDEYRNYSKSGGSARHSRGQAPGEKRRVLPAEIVDAPAVTPSPRGEDAIEAPLGEVTGGPEDELDQAVNFMKQFGLFGGEVPSHVEQRLKGDATFRSMVISRVGQALHDTETNIDRIIQAADHISTKIDELAEAAIHEA